jgi:pimeloyl-ACP methyl ester carboxylesterase
VTGIDEWWATGRRVPIELERRERAVFVRRVGSGPALTLLHGFPSSSHDFAAIAPGLAERFAMLLPDFLGFGASDKPADHVYSLHEQADLVERVWAAEGITETGLVAHDYGVSVAQELLARRAEGRLQTELVAVYLLNGGLYPELHRPQPVQMALLDSEEGPRIGAALTPELTAAALKPTFADEFDARAYSAAIYRSITRDDGQRILHRLIRYIPDRFANAERWVGALERTDVPLAFVWGMLDPVSGAQIAAKVRQRLPDAPFAALDDVGHWPQLEAPERVLAALGDVTES